MKEKHLLTLLSIEAAACVLFCILQRSVSGFFSTIVAFPFEQLGEGLRALSLSGGAGKSDSSWNLADLKEETESHAN